MKDSYMSIWLPHFNWPWLAYPLRYQFDFKYENCCFWNHFLNRPKFDSSSAKIWWLIIFQYCYIMLIIIKELVWRWILIKTLAVIHGHSLSTQTITCRPSTHAHGGTKRTRIEERPVQKPETWKRNVVLCLLLPHLLPLVTIKAEPRADKQLRQ